MTNCCGLPPASRRGSEHPLAFAILNAAKEQGIALGDVQNFDSPAGKGASGTVDGRRVVLGNAAIMQLSGIETKALEKDALDQRERGATAIYVPSMAGLPASSPSPIRSSRARRRRSGSCAPTACASSC